MGPGRRRFLGSLVVSALLALAVPLLLASPASAGGDQVYVGVPPPTVVQYDPPPVKVFSPPVPARAPVRYLALTGGDVLGILGLGLGALAAGLVLTRAGRQRPLVVIRSGRRSSAV